jgi:hypothetical protein
VLEWFEEATFAFSTKKQVRQLMKTIYDTATTASADYHKAVIKRYKLQQKRGYSQLVGAMDEVLSLCQNRDVTFFHTVEERVNELNSQLKPAAVDAERALRLARERWYDCLIADTQHIIACSWSTKWQQRAAGKQLPELRSKKASWRLEYKDHMAMIEQLEKTWNTTSTQYLKGLRSAMKSLENSQIEESGMQASRDAREAAAQRIRQYQEQQHQKQLADQEPPAKLPGRGKPRIPVTVSSSVHARDTAARIERQKEALRKKKEEEQKESESTIEAAKKHKTEANAAIRTTSRLPKLKKKSTNPSSGPARSEWNDDTEVPATFDETLPPVPQKGETKKASSKKGVRGKVDGTDNSNNDSTNNDSTNNDSTNNDSTNTVANDTHEPSGNESSTEMVSNGTAVEHVVETEEQPPSNEQTTTSQAPTSTVGNQDTLTSAPPELPTAAEPPLNTPPVTTTTAGTTASTTSAAPPPPPPPPMPVLTSPSESIPPPPPPPPSQQAPSTTTATATTTSAAPSTQPQRADILAQIRNFRKEDGLAPAKQPRLRVSTTPSGGQGDLMAAMEKALKKIRIATNGSL